MIICVEPGFSLREYGVWQDIVTILMGVDHDRWSQPIEWDFKDEIT